MASDVRALDHLKHSVCFLDTEASSLCSMLNPDVLFSCHLSEVNSINMFNFLLFKKKKYIFFNFNIIFFQRK